MMVLIINLEEEYDGRVMENPNEVEMSKPLDNMPMSSIKRYECYP
jgi:hypothetical protein